MRQVLLALCPFYSWGNQGAGSQVPCWDLSAGRVQDWVACREASWQSPACRPTRRLYTLLASRSTWRPHVATCAFLACDGAIHLPAPWSSEELLCLPKWAHFLSGYLYNQIQFSWANEVKSSVLVKSAITTSCVCFSAWTQHYSFYCSFWFKWLI